MRPKITSQNCDNNHQTADAVQERTGDISLWQFLKDNGKDLWNIKHPQDWVKQGNNQDAPFQDNQKPGFDFYISLDTCESSQTKRKKRRSKNNFSNLISSILPPFHMKIGYNDLHSKQQTENSNSFQKSSEKCFLLEHKSHLTDMRKNYDVQTASKLGGENIICLERKGPMEDHVKHYSSQVRANYFLKGGNNISKQKEKSSTSSNEANGCQKLPKPFQTHIYSDPGLGLRTSNNNIVTGSCGVSEDESNPTISSCNSDDGYNEWYNCGKKHVIGKRKQSDRPDNMNESYFLENLLGYLQHGNGSEYVCRNQGGKNDGMEKQIEVGDQMGRVSGTVSESFSSNEKNRYNCFGRTLNSYSSIEKYSTDSDTLNHSFLTNTDCGHDLLYNYLAGVDSNVDRQSSSSYCGVRCFTFSSTCRDSECRKLRENVKLSTFGHHNECEIVQPSTQETCGANTKLTDNCGLLNNDSRLKLKVKKSKCNAEKVGKSSIALGCECCKPVQINIKTRADQREHEYLTVKKECGKKKETGEKCTKRKLEKSENLKNLHYDGQHRRLCVEGVIQANCPLEYKIKSCQPKIHNKFDKVSSGQMAMANVGTENVGIEIKSAAIEQIEIPQVSAGSLDTSEDMRVLEEMEKIQVGAQQQDEDREIKSADLEPAEEKRISIESYGGKEISSIDEGQMEILQVDAGLQYGDADVGKIEMAHVGAKQESLTLEMSDKEEKGALIEGVELKQISMEQIKEITNGREEMKMVMIEVVAREDSEHIDRSSVFTGEDKVLIDEIRAVDSTMTDQIAASSSLSCQSFIADVHFSLTHQLCIKRDGGICVEKNNSEESDEARLLPKDSSESEAPTQLHSCELELNSIVFSEMQHWEGSARKKISKSDAGQLNLSFEKHHMGVAGKNRRPKKCYENVSFANPRILTHDKGNKSSRKNDTQNIVHENKAKNYISNHNQSLNKNRIPFFSYFGNDGSKEVGGFSKSNLKETLDAELDEEDEIKGLLGLLCAVQCEIKTMKMKLREYRYLECLPLFYENMTGLYIKERVLKHQIEILQCETKSKNFPQSDGNKTYSQFKPTRNANRGGATESSDLRKVTGNRSLRQGEKTNSAIQTEMNSKWYYDNVGSHNEGNKRTHINSRKKENVSNKSKALLILRENDVRNHMETIHSDDGTSDDSTNCDYIDGAVNDRVQWSNCVQYHFLPCDECLHVSHHNLTTVSEEEMEVSSWHLWNLLPETFNPLSWICNK